MDATVDRRRAYFELPDLPSTAGHQQRCANVLLLCDAPSRGVAELSCRGARHADGARKFQDFLGPFLRTVTSIAVRVGTGMYGPA
jgi:hypothetical protein